MNQIKNIFKKLIRPTSFGIIILVVIIITITLTSGALYQKTSQILDVNLRERLLAIVTTAVVEFDSHDVEQLRKEDDWKKPEWEKVVHLMEKIRKNNPNILFMYMFRKTDADPTQMEFVADSHSINPYALVDINNDEVIDDGDQLQWPGQPYETAPTEAFLAYSGPTTNAEIYSDQWGPVLTGYAPIKNENGDTVAVLAVDIKAGDFAIITRQTLQPFLIFITSLSLIISILILIIIFSWKRYAESLERLNYQIKLANEGQMNLIHIINHQIKGYFAKSRNIFSELLTEPSYGPVTEASKPMMEEGFRSLTEGVEFVQGILTSSSVESGTFVYNMEKTNFKDIVQNVVEKQKGRAEAKGLHYEFQASDGNYKIMGDASQLREVTKNLLDNSINYTRAGGVKINLSVQSGKVLLSVEDTGKGITPEFKKVLFTKGGRSKDSIKYNVDSTGYGLAFVKGVIEAHKGRIWAESEGENKGSTFYIELPTSA